MTALSPRQMHTLDHACKPITEAFSNAPFLVGTAGVRGSAYRDVDVRLILTDKEYRKLKRAVGKRGITLMGFAIGEWLANRTGMPIDFQIQQMTSANAQHDGMRNPLGVRHLGNWPGDGAPLPAQATGSGDDRG
jgi:hypothetical protein